MKPLTVEVMRGKLESFVSTAQRASELFESYLSQPPNSAEKKKDRERLMTVLTTIKSRHEGLMAGLKEAMKEDA